MPLQPSVVVSSAPRSRGPQRKVCDLCYTKKLKCDRKKPSCSNCINYSVECTHGAAKATVEGAGRRATNNRRPGVNRRQIRAEETQTTEDEVRLIGDHGASSNEPSHDARPSEDRALVLDPALEVGPILEQPSQSPVSVFAAQGYHMELPPYEHIQPVVEAYLLKCNMVLPLFDAGEARDTVRRWYAYPDQRDALQWGLLNIILAHAHRSLDTSKDATRGIVSRYLSNAQSVLSDLLMADISLTTVRILIGIVCLFQAMPDLRAATLLIGTALRLAHQLELQTRIDNPKDKPCVQLLRDRVFWMAYMLDKDISQRTKQPPVQADTDIDLDLPFDAPCDSVGILQNQGVKFGFFRSRILLARVQGTAYEMLWSAAAKRRDEKHRREQAQIVISQQLDEWESEIPPHFQFGTPHCTRDIAVIRFLLMLHSGHLACRALIHGVDGLILPQAQDLYKSSFRRREDISEDEHWEVLAVRYRPWLRDFVDLDFHDPTMVWAMVGTLFTGVLCLTANMLQGTAHDSYVSDIALCEVALKNMEEFMLFRDSARFQVLSEVYKKTLERAKALAPPQHQAAGAGHSNIAA